MNFKNILILAVLCGWGSFASAQEPIKIKGKIKGLATDQLYLTVMADGVVREDSVSVAKDKFTYEFESSTFSAIRIYPKYMANTGPDKFKEVVQSAFTVYADPGDVLKISGQRLSYLIDYEVAGNEVNNDFVAMSHRISPVLDEKLVIDFNDELQSYYSPTGKMFMPGENSKEQQNQIDQIQRDFMAQNPDSYYTMYEMAFAKSKEVLGNYLKQREGRPQHPYFQGLLDMRLASFGVDEKGTQAPNIMTSDLNKKSFNLTDLRGKYVILDFWGTWCGPCVMGIPDMKKYYEKYQGKLDIVGIACNEKNGVEGVQKMVAKKEMPWVQLMNGEDLNNYVKMFGVTGFPTKFILDQEGKVLNKFIGEGEAFYKYLDEVLAD